MEAEMFELPAGVNIIISEIEKCGHEAYIVGGCVRDILLGKTPNDYDITASATPDELREIFKARRTVDTGIRHGTLTVIIDGEPYEVTTYRVDGEYSDARHPDSVSFTRTLSEDLSRRDFTVNAMAYNERVGVCDLFYGREDLASRIIRAVGDARVRFSEDALRILRALRFSSTLDFEIEDATARAIFEKRELLSLVSRERIYAEWRKLIGGVGARRVISEFSKVIEVFMPGIAEARIDTPSFDFASPELRELYLFARADRDCCAENFDRTMTELRCDNRHKDYGFSVLSGIDLPIESETDIRLLFVRCGETVARGIIKLKRLLGEAAEDTERILEGLSASGFCYKISDMKINGEDLISLGYKGRRIGEVLSALIYDIAVGKIENNREELLKRVAEMK